MFGYTDVNKPNDFLPKSGTFLLKHPVYIYIYIYIYTHTHTHTGCLCVCAYARARMKLLLEHYVRFGRYFYKTLNFTFCLIYSF